MDVLLPLMVGYPVRHGRPVTLAGEGCRRHSFVAARDLAAFAVAAVNHPAALETFDSSIDMMTTTHAFG